MQAECLATASPFVQSDAHRYICMCNVYIYIYIERERDREREREIM